MRQHLKLNHNNPQLLCAMVLTYYLCLTSHLPRLAASGTQQAVGHKRPLSQVAA